MTRRESPSVTAMRLAVAVGLTASALLAVSAIFRFPFEPLRIMLLSLSAPFAFFAPDMLWKIAPVRFRAPVLLVALSLTALYLWKTESYLFFVETAQDYFSFIAGYNLYDPRPTESGIKATMLLTAFTSGLACNNFVVRRISGAVVSILYLLIIALPFQMVDETQYGLSVMLLLASLLFFFVLRAYVRHRESCDIKPGDYMKVGVPVCAAILLLSVVLPYSNNSGYFVERSIEVADAVFSYGFFGNSRTMTLADTGSVELGGVNMMPDTLLFSVRANVPFYLYSGVYDVYTGSSWEKSGFGMSMDGRSYQSENPNMTGYSPPRFAFDSERYPGGLPSYMREDVLKAEAQPLSVLYHRLSTDIVLMPRYCDSITLLSEGALSVDVNGIMFVEPEAGPDFSYQAWAYLPDYPAIKEDMSGLYASSYRRMMNKRRSYVDSVYGGQSGVDVEFVYRMLTTNMELPDTVTERTRELAQELMEPLDSVYDYAVRVQNYLAQNYTYNLEVAELPEGADFVDHFLFESKEGYCTYYASAMAVLLRSVGIPARYCQGFGLDPSRYQNGIYQVTAQDAHAWVEVMMPNGWLTFDPTASGSGSYYRSMQRENVVTAFSDDMMRVPDMEPESHDTPDIPETVPSAQPESEPVKQIPPYVWILLSVPATLAAAGLLILLRFIRKLYFGLRCRHVTRKKPDERALYWYGLVLSLLKADGIRMARNETLGEFMRRVEANHPAIVSDLTPVVNLMQRVFYSRELLHSDDVYFMEHSCRLLAMDLSVSWSKTKRLWETYITGRLAL